LGTLLVKAKNDKMWSPWLCLWLQQKNEK